MGLCGEGGGWLFGRESGYIEREQIQNISKIHTHTYTHTHTRYAK